MPDIDPAALEQLIPALKAKHRVEELHLLSARVTGDTYQILVKSPPAPEYQEFRDYLADDGKRTRAYERLLRSCVVHPDMAALDAMLAAKPGLISTFGTQLTQIAGAVEDVESKKF